MSLLQTIRPSESIKIKKNKAKMSPELCGIILLVGGLSGLIGAIWITTMVYEWLAM